MGILATRLEKGRERSKYRRERHNRAVLQAGLVRVWRDAASGRVVEAREGLVDLWHQDEYFLLENPASGQFGRVVLRLFDRLAPVTDDPDTWAQLPERIEIYKVGSPDTTDLNWTLDEMKVAFYNWEYGIPETAGTVGKQDVLAYLSLGKKPGLGDILVRSKHVTVVRYTGPPRRSGTG